MFIADFWECVFKTPLIGEVFNWCWNLSSLQDIQCYLVISSWIHHQKLTPLQQSKLFPHPDFSDTAWDYYSPTENASQRFNFNMSARVLRWSGLGWSYSGMGCGQLCGLCSFQSLLFLTPISPYHALFTFILTLTPLFSLFTFICSEFDDSLSVAHYSHSFSLFLNFTFSFAVT